MNHITKGPHLFNQLMHESAIDFKAGISNPIDKQRLRWTTLNNLNTWHKNWERCLIELGFASKMMGKDGKEIIVVADDQKACILNLDESAFILDWNSKQQGGQPAVTFFDEGLPTHSIVAGKSLQSTTFITGSWE